ncbi:MAG: hypothetical protein ACE5EQ_02495 [Phycisphaerae bacterium]
MDCTLGPAGNQTRVDERDNLGNIIRTVVYDYDALYRLTHEAITFPTNSAKNRTTDSTYDKVGNRLQMVIRMVGQTPSCTTTVEYQYDPLDRLTQETRTVILAAGEFDDGRHYAVNFADGTQQVVAAPRRRPEQIYR